MADEATPPPKGGGSGLRDVAKLLESYVPKGEHDQALETLNELMNENEQLKGIVEKFGKNPEKLHARVQELEGKVRHRNHKDAYDKLVDELKINPEFKDDVFELAKLTIEGDEPDTKAMKKALAAFLEDRPRYIKAEEEGEQPATRTGKQLEVREETGRGSHGAPASKFRYRNSDLSDPMWMAKNADAYAAAANNGDLMRVGD